MDETIYRVLPKDDQWRLEHDGQSIAYRTRTAAIEAAVDAAKRAMRNADEVKIYVAPAPGQNAS
jgi:Uncharacterized protein conserved in bacteria (DUF2188)